MRTNRRQFLAAGGLSAAAAARAIGANDLIRIGAIGCGGRMHALLDAAAQAGKTQLTAVCDVYEPRRDAVRARSHATPSSHLDYHELLAKNEVDAVIVSTPDHWHVRMACDAIGAGKDVYLEKPVTHTLEEGDVLLQAVRASNRIVQCGMQQRSWVHFQSAVDLIQGGNIGRVTRVRTYWYQNYQQPEPSNPMDLNLLDWNRWLGPAPGQPFSEEKFRRWRWFWDFGGGALTDLFPHWIDVVHWAMKVDQPELAVTMGDRYVFDRWQCPDTVQTALRYRGFEAGHESTMISSIDDGGIEFRGTAGTLKISRRGFDIYREGAQAQNPALTEHSIEDGTLAHVRNFLDCIRDRKQPNAPPETGVAAARAGHIANLAFKRGAYVAWPPKAAPA